MSETSARFGMSRKEAQELVAGPLRFGDQKQIDAAMLLDLIEKQNGGGEAIVCTQCGEQNPSLKRHFIGCFLCPDCTVLMNKHLTKWDRI